MSPQLGSAQLGLPFALREQSTFDRFVPGTNRELMHQLRQRPTSFQCVWLFGEPGVGKTHLLQALCHEQAASAYVPAGRIAASALALSGYGEFDTVSVDDLEHWLGGRESELALLELHNQLASRNARLVVTARLSPVEIDFALADLASRLRAAACYRVAPLDDDDRAALLAEAARRRSLELTPEVVRYLLARADRDQRELLRLLDNLDALSLAAKRRITVPFVKEALCL